MSFFDNTPNFPKENNLFSNQFKLDTNPNKINAAIGMIWNDKGQLHELPFIKDIEQTLYDNKLDKEYSTLLGITSFNKDIFEYLLPNQKLTENFFCTQSTTGGSALKIGSDILRNYFNKKIYLSNLTFSLYYNLFSEMEIDTYPYFNCEKNEFEFESMKSFLENLPNKSLINLQVSNHNPTGIDLDKSQWDELSAIFKQKQHFAFFDCAYLGLTTGNKEDDMYCIDLWVKENLEFFLAYSSAKTTLNYSDDIGYLIGYLNNNQAVENVKSNIAVLNRGMYSFSSLQGARILNSIITNKEWREAHYSYIQQISKELSSKKLVILEKLGSYKALWKLISKQKGLYLFLNLSKDQIKNLQENYSIYVADNGRVNLSALNSSNIDYFVDCLSKIIA